MDAAYASFAWLDHPVQDVVDPVAKQSGLCGNVHSRCFASFEHAKNLLHNLA
jgi:hypothetical protein